MTTTLAAPHVQVLADHSALLAIPAFAPAILVVAVVIWVARRDRRMPDDEDDETHSERPGSTGEDGSP
ncbi:hypothetical protein TUM20985_02170 [Mycobacterium antarcticum]|uniref:hypothetical protein n=1 Tax=Mycolicibacterium sp. TUM20985 TaxID=3023370 RepID=UPI00257466D7|nr:hypothetical protein [Mycolicibacterium sp. TUM20985]BDX29670.1 hypothetical protein TUM20985_02170 [Mycolicibacterium sp. TUM20985]